MMHAARRKIGSGENKLIKRLAGWDEQRREEELEKTATRSLIRSQVLLENITNGNARVNACYPGH
jgi:hypothetical protein